LEQAKALNRLVPDDNLVYGLMADAAVELGEYKEAEEAAQWMIDLRSVNVPGFQRGATLRELFGDFDGALDWLNSAFRMTSSNEVEERAWILTRIARLELRSGKIETAEKRLHEALALVADYPHAIEFLAQVRTAQQKHLEAAELLRKRLKMAPEPRILFALADALARAGRAEESKASFADFEQQARKLADKADNANRELVFYYTEYASNPAEALKIAQGEAKRRHDVYTLDAYAWALFKNGNHAEAQSQMKKTLAVGIRDATLFYHAGLIEQNRDAAARYFRQSLELNPYSPVAADVKKALLMR